MNKSDHFLFHCYELDKVALFLHTRFIFNSEEHLRLQHAKNWWIYELLNQQTRAVKARIAFHMDGDKAQSPFRAPFGFIEFLDDIIDSELTVFFFVDRGGPESKRDKGNSNKKLSGSL